MEYGDKPEKTTAAANSVPVTNNRLIYLYNAPRLLVYPFVLLLQLAASALGGIGFVTGNPPSLLLTGTFLWLVWFVTLFLMACSTADPVLERYSTKLRKASLTVFGLLAVTFIGELIFMGFMLAGIKPSGLLHELDKTFLYNDATALCHQATQNFIEGKNPYANGNVVLAIEEFGGASDRITPRRAGILATVFPYPNEQQLQEAWQKAINNPDKKTVEIETRMNYPAGAFILPAPFIWLGINDIRWVYLIFVLISLGITIGIAPTKYRIPLAAVYIVGIPFWNSILGGETGTLAFPFMLLGWILVKRNLWLSAILMGLAMTVKQTSFFLVPFYLILIYRTVGIKRSLISAGIMAVIFGGVNLPFIIDNPGLWINSMGAPMSEDFFPLGAGLITIVTSGLVDIRSTAIFTLMEGIVLGAGLAWYFLNCRKFPNTGPVLAFFPLFFAWRSLWSYFFYIDIIVLTAVIFNEYGNTNAMSNPKKNELIA
jgi:hypothetical protein